MRYYFLVTCCLGVLGLHGRCAIDFAPIDYSVPSFRTAKLPDHADVLSPPAIPVQLDEWLRPAASKFNRKFSPTIVRPAWIELTAIATFFCYWIHATDGATFWRFITS